jgi:sec-independent protein translocase protein TatB
MIDLGISKLVLIGAVALIVIGPEKLPGLARTVGTWLGKAQRYLADVKSEVSRSIELDELKKMKASMEGAAKDVTQSIQTNAAEFEKSWAEATNEASEELPRGRSSTLEVPPEYRHPKKNWRLKQGATPNWFKARAGVRTRALSGAARVARFRPTKFN